MRYLLLILSISTLLSKGMAQEVIRGPYLQSPGEHSIVIRWRTDLSTDSRVTFGAESMTELPFIVDDNTITTEHRIKLSGLTGHTKYFYSIGSTEITLMNPEEGLYFKTAPGEDDPLSVWVIGDFGHGNQAQIAVRESYMEYAVYHPSDLWLWLGDNVYSDGTDQEYQEKVFDGVFGYRDIFPHLPFASTSGNHDYNSICPWQAPNGFPVLCNIDPNLHTGPYLDIIDPPTQGELGGVPSGKKLYYSFDYGDIHFVSLNSELGSWNPSYNWIGMFNNDTSFTSPMLDWLRTDLASTTKKWKVVFWHQCPYSGQLNFTEEWNVQQFCVATRHHFNPILEKYGADLVLTGHDHNYQRSFLINGHYYGKGSFMPEMMIDGGSGKESEGQAYIKYTNGPDEGKGTVYVLQGNSSGGNDESPIVHPAIYWGQACDTCWGSFIFDVVGDRLDGRYLTAYGEILDEFTILKQSVVTASPDEIHEIVECNVFPNPSGGTAILKYHGLKPNSEIQVVILSTDGKPVSFLHGKTNTQSHFECRLDLHGQDLPAGSYVVKVHDEENLIVRKIIVVR